MRKRSAGFALIEVLLTIAVLAAIAATGWFYYQHTKQSVKQTAKTAVSPADNSDLQPDVVVSAVKAGLAKQYTLLDLNKNGQPSQGQLSIRVEASSPAYKADGYNFYTDYAGGASLYALSPGSGSASGVIPNAIDIKIRRYYVSILSSFGLKKVQTYGQTSDGTGTDVWKGRGIVCNVDPEVNAEASTALGCGEISAYAATAAKLQPLVNVYPLHTPESVFVRPKFTESPIEGYQRAEIGTGAIGLGGGSVAMFYRLPSGDWKYFRSVQEELPCSQFNTTELRNAYRGVKCLDATSAEAVIQ